MRGGAAAADEVGGGGRVNKKQVDRPEVGAKAAREGFETEGESGETGELLGWSRKRC